MNVVGHPVEGQNFTFIISGFLLDAAVKRPLDLWGDERLPVPRRPDQVQI
jgi:hypothetical protein